jgi:hypothetical protein
MSRKSFHKLLASLIIYCHIFTNIAAQEKLSQPKRYIGTTDLTLFYPGLKIGIDTGSKSDDDCMAAAFFSLIGIGIPFLITCINTEAIKEKNLIETIQVTLTENSRKKSTGNVKLEMNGIMGCSKLSKSFIYQDELNGELSLFESLVELSSPRIGVIIVNENHITLEFPNGLGKFKTSSEKNPSCVWDFSKTTSIELTSI